MFLMHLLAHLPNILASELRNLTTKGDGNKKELLMMSRQIMWQRRFAGSAWQRGTFLGKRLFISDK
jgi:hypothetical protein